MELSYGNALRFGWVKLKGWWKVVAAYGVVMLLFQAISNVIARYGGSAGALLTIPFSFFFSMLSTTFILYMADTPERSGEVMMELQKYWEYFKAKLGLFFRFLGLQVVIGALVMVALIGLVLMAAVPAIIGQATGAGVTGIYLALTGVFGLVAFVALVVLATRLQWATFVLVDEMVGIGDSIRRSWEITRGRVLWLFGWGLLIVVLMLVGLLALIVGAVIVMLVATLATGWIYRMMASSAAKTQPKKMNKHQEEMPVMAEVG